MVEAARDGSSERGGECGFCEIVAGTGDSVPIVTRDRARAIMSLTDGHPLIIPNTHFEDLTVPKHEVDQDATLILMRKLFPSVESTFKDLKKSDGVRTLINQGALQHVPHFHIHLKPFQVSGGREIPILIPSVEERREIAGEISARFQATRY